MLTTAHSRRRLLQSAALTVVAALGISGCAAAEPSADEPVTITMWNWVDSSEAIALFEESHPHIKVELDLVAAGGPTYAKMFAAIQAGNTPDVGLIELNTLPQFIGTGGLADLTEYGANDIKDDFLPWAWSQVSNGDAVYALPLSASPIGYHYNAELLSQYGISEVPETYAELADAAATYRANNPDGYLVDVSPTAGFMAMLVWQAGGRWFEAKDDHWEVGFTSAESQQVAEYLQVLVDNDLVFTEAAYQDTWFQALNGGQLASFVGPQWSDALLASQVASQSGKYTISTAPQWNAGQQVDGQQGGGSLAVFKDSEHPAEAYEFVQWMLQNSDAQSLNYNSGYGWPTTISGGEIPELSQELEFFNNQDPQEIYVASNNATNQDWQWGPNFATVSSDFGDLLAKALSGEMTIWEAFQAQQVKEMDRLEAAGISAVEAK